MRSNKKKPNNVGNAFLLSISYTFLKVHEVPRGDFEGQDLWFGPVLRINCSHVVNFAKLVTVQLPVSLRGEQKEIGNTSKCRVRVLFLRSRGEHKEWTEITGDLLDPASFDGKFVRFQVDHFSGYGYSSSCKPGKGTGVYISLLSASFLFFLFSLNCYKLKSSLTIKKQQQQQQQQPKANHRYLISSNNSRGR